MEAGGWGLILLAGVGYGVVTWWIYRHEEFPGKRSFIAACLLNAVFLLSLVPLFAVSRMNIPPPVGVIGFLALFVAYLSALVMPLAWVRFALQFTGQQVPTDRRSFIRLGIPVFVALAAIAVPVSIAVLSVAFGELLVTDETISLSSGGSAITSSP